MSTPTPEEVRASYFSDLLKLHNFATMQLMREENSEERIRYFLKTMDMVRTSLERSRFLSHER